MEFAACVDISTDEDPQTVCTCRFGRIKSEDGQQCLVPPPTSPTPRPIPTLAPEVKLATSAVTRSASTVLIIFVVATLILFMSLKVFDTARVIQMNMEISLVCAHLCLLLPSSLSDHPFVSGFSLRYFIGQLSHIRFFHLALSLPLHIYLARISRKTMAFIPRNIQSCFHLAVDSMKLCLNLLFNCLFIPPFGF